MVFQSTIEPKLEPQVFKNGISVESHVAKNVYNIVAYSVSGLIYEWLIKTLCVEEQLESKNNKISVWEIIKKKASSAPVGSNCIFFAPYLAGAGSPHFDNKSMGAFVGLKNNSDKTSLIRSVIEGLNYQFKDMVSAFENASNLSPEKIIGAGGATQNEFWMQNKADITGKLIEVPKVEEATPLGAAILAGIGINVYSNEKEACQKTYKIGLTYEPNFKNKNAYDEYYPIFKKLYTNLKELNIEIYEKFRK